MHSNIVVRDPDILGGTPVFAGTRVPVRAIFDYLEAADDLDEFLDDFPGVTREQARSLLRLAREKSTGDGEAGIRDLCAARF